MDHTESTFAGSFQLRGKWGEIPYPRFPALWEVRRDPLRAVSRFVEVRTDPLPAVSGCVGSEERSLTRGFRFCGKWGRRQWIFIPESTSSADSYCVLTTSVSQTIAIIIIIIITMYIYHALINALSVHMIHINLNTIFYTHVEHSPTKTIYIKYYTEKRDTHTHLSLIHIWRCHER